MDTFNIYERHASLAIECLTKSGQVGSLTGYLLGIAKYSDELSLTKRINILNHLIEVFEEDESEHAKSYVVEFKEFKTELENEQAGQNG